MSWSINSRTQRFPFFKLRIILTVFMERWNIGWKEKVGYSWWIIFVLSCLHHCTMGCTKTRKSATVQSCKIEKLRSPEFTASSLDVGKREKSSGIFPKVHCSEPLSNLITTATVDFHENWRDSFYPTTHRSVFDYGQKILTDFGVQRRFTKGLFSWSFNFYWFWRRLHRELE